MNRFLQKSELAERRAFIETFVKEIELLPDNAVVRYIVPMPDDSIILGEKAHEIPLNGSAVSTVKASPLDLTKSRIFVSMFTLALQLVLRREPRPARSGPRQASFPCPHQPARADYSLSCQADMAAIRPPLTVSGASQASLRHPPTSFGIRPRSSVPLRTGPVSRN